MVLVEMDAELAGPGGLGWRRVWEGEIANPDDAATINRCLLNTASAMHYGIDWSVARQVRVTFRRSG